MKIRKTEGMPEVIYQWLKQDLYDGTPDSISATTLLKPVQEYWLTKRHWDSLEVDATDRVFSLFGAGIHAVLEKVKGDYQQEERLFADIGDTKVSGKFDLIENNRLVDYKTTSAWTLIYRSRDTEWQKQLSIYRWLYKQSKGIELDSVAHIIAILRDWSQSNLGRVKNYPEQPIVEIPIPLMTLNDTFKMIKKQIDLINETKDVHDDCLPKCTQDEMWYNRTKGEYIKCSKYCIASSVCCQKERRENGTTSSCDYIG